MLLVGSVCILTSACILISARQVSATAEMDLQAKSMVAPPEKALVYYYRYGLYRPNKEYWYKLYMDNKCVAGSIWPPGFYVWLLTPGSHSFEIHESKLILNAIGGKTYYIRLKGEFFSFNLNMEIMDKELGRKNIEESHLLIANGANECGRTSIPSEIDTRMKNLTAPEDKALVYLYRSPIVYDYQDATVHLDDKPPVEIAAGTYLLWQITPGTHIVASDGGKLTLDAKAGSTYYIRVDITHSVLGVWRYPLQLVDKEGGRKGVEDSLLMTETPMK